MKKISLRSIDRSVSPRLYHGSMNMESSNVWTELRFAFLRLSVLIVFAVFTAAPLVAGQASSRESQDSRIAASQQADAREAKKISLRLNDVTLETALKNFVKESGLRLTYSRDVVSLDKRVSLEVKDMPAIEMLKLLLGGRRPRGAQDAYRAVRVGGRRSGREAGGAARNRGDHRRAGDRRDERRTPRGHEHIRCRNPLGCLHRRQRALPSFECPGR